MPNPEFHHTFYEKFETSDLLDAVSHLDILRQALSDDEDWRPPEVRQDLLKLHQLAMEVSHRGDMTQAQPMFDLAFEIEDQLLTVWESLTAIEKIVQGITDLADEFYDDFDEEE